MNRKILFVITKSNWGGAQKYVYDLATNLPRSYECAVALGGNGLLKKRLEEKGIEVIHIPHLERNISLLKEFPAFYFLLRHLRKNHFDIIHLNSSKAGGLGALVAWLCGVKKIIFTAHGWPFYEDRNIFSRAIIKFLSWLTVLFSHFTIVVCERDYRAFEGWPFTTGKIVRIYNGILETNKIAEESKINIPKPTVGVVAELHPNKGLRFLIEAMKDISASLIIVGEGQERNELERLAKEFGLSDRIYFFGFAERATEIMNAFDVFVLPSIKEGLPLVILEAGIQGVPVVATRVGGIPEIVTDEESGLLVNPKNSVEIARAVNALLQNEELKRKYGTALADVVRKKFNFEKTLEETLALYER